MLEEAWNLFYQTGNIEAYLLFKELQEESSQDLKVMEYPNEVMHSKTMAFEEKGVGGYVKKD